MKNLFFFLFCAACLPVTAQIHTPFLQVPLISTKPVIDGNLSEPSWQKAAVMTEFVNWSRNGYIKDPVEVFIYCDLKNFYVAFRNHDPEAAGLEKSVSPKGPHDTFLWGRHHAMVGVKSGENYIQVMADPKGTMTDWKNGDISWNGTWNYAASINKSDWTCEFSIPIGDAGIADISKVKKLDLTFSRSYPTGESSNWNGECSISPVFSTRIETSGWSAPVPGENSFPLSIRNSGKNPLSIQVQMQLTPLNGEPEFINQAGQGPSSSFQLKTSSESLKYTYDMTIPAGGTVQRKLTYNLPAEGSYFATMTAKSKDGTMLKRTVDFWFTVEPNKKKLNSLVSLAGESIALTARISNPVADDLKKESEKLLSDVQNLQKNADEYWKSGKWNELTKLAAKKEIEIIQLLNKVKECSLYNWNSIQDFGLALSHSAIKLKKDELFPLPLTNKIDISLARNEYESFQLAILPYGKDLVNLKVDISDLQGTNGNVIPLTNIGVSLVDYNLIDWQADYVASKGWHPDPLLPFKPGMKISGLDACRPLWLTVYAPAGSKAGDYKGTITVSADGLKPSSVSVNCRVWDFDLPVESHLKTHSWDDIEYLADFYNKEEYPVEWYLKFCDLLLKNRMNPGSAGVNYRKETPDSNGKYDFSRVEKVLEFCIKRGLNRFSLTQMKKGLYKPEEEKQIYAFIEAYAKFLRSKGWLDKALVELWDEPTDLEWPYIKERAEKLKKIDPGLRLQLFAEGGPYDFYERNTDKYGLNSLVNIWAPVNIIESPETQARGGEIWTYFCTLARESAPNFFIDCPAIFQRSIAWYCWMYGVDGFEHWSTTYFWRNLNKGKPLDQKWPAVPWDSRTYYYFNGEGQLVYPGPDGNLVSSVRLENFREGMEDYEYLFRLRELLSKYDSNDNDPQIIEFRELLKPESYLLLKYPRKIKVSLENTIRYPDRPELMIEMRNRIAQAIETLQKL